MGSNKPTGKEELSQYFINRDVVDKVILQVEKDLYPYFDGHRVIEKLDGMSFEEFRNVLASTLIEIDEQGSTELRSILYKVDVPEQQYLLQVGKDNFYTVLADAILNRELKKVLFRLHYS